METDRLALTSFSKDLAHRLDNYKATFEAGLLEFELEASLARYHGLKNLVRDEWAATRAELLDILRRTDYGNRHAAADIFLSEGLPEDAVNIASKFSNDASLLRKVMAAVMSTHAAWIVASAQKQAEPIMDAGRSNHYDEAASWLGFAKGAYGATGETTKWESYISGVRKKHKRKYRLMEALEAL